MTVKLSKNDARQGERRIGQERVLIWSVAVAGAALGAITIVAIFM